MNKHYLFLGLMVVLLALPFVVADGPDLNAPITPEDKAQFDQILSPVIKLYTLVKYAATLLAAIFLLYAGITYMSSGEDPRKRDTAKSIATYVLIGLVVIWAAPYLTNLLL